MGVWNQKDYRVYGVFTMDNDLLYRVIGCVWQPDFVNWDAVREKGWKVLMTHYIHGR